MHATTHERPIDRWVEEGLRPIPSGYACERYLLEERQVTRDGFISFDGVLYGVPASAKVTGRTVQVGCDQQTIRIWAAGQVIATHPIQQQSGRQVLHPEQFTDVPSASQSIPAHQPRGHQIAPPTMLGRELEEYDRLCGTTATEVAA